MLRIASICLFAAASVWLSGCQSSESQASAAEAKAVSDNESETSKIPNSSSDKEQDMPSSDTKGEEYSLEPIERTERQWREMLSAKQFRVMRKEGTERAFTGRYWDNKADGVYLCAGCDLPVFGSDTKFKSGTGWPSFYQPYQDEFVETKKDYHLFLPRIEVHCKRCKSHLGHVFEDGPEPTGLRYCINSVSLKFQPADEKSKDK